MPRGRFISKSISSSDQLASDSVSLPAALLFTWMIPHLDSAGRITGNPRSLKALVCPMRDDIHSGVTPDLLRSLAGVGLLRWYEVNGQHVIECPGFRNHQQGLRVDREAKSNFPDWSESAKNLAAVQNGGSPQAEEIATPDLLRTYSGLTPELPNSGPTPDELRTNSALSEVKLSEGKVSKENDANASSSGSAEPNADQVVVIFEYWKKATGASARTTLTEQRRKAIKARLKKFSPEDLKQAIDGVMLSEHHSSNAQYRDVTSCFKNDTRVEQHIATATNGTRVRSRPGKPDPEQEFVDDVTRRMI